MLSVIWMKSDQRVIVRLAVCLSIAGTVVGKVGVSIAGMVVGKVGLSIAGMVVGKVGREGSRVGG